jgi:alginate O-acetyltransferase complex protein AlgI
VYNNPEIHGGLQNLIATFFFSFQIYCDFSGYSDIAIGTALVMGYKLMTNFRRPYLASNIREFWQRWHISLSAWFRDYVYIPLGGRRVAKWRWQLNLFITFTVSGLWHGADWNFIIWGALHGFYLIFAIWTGRWHQNFNKFTGLQNNINLLGFSRAVATFILVYFSWIFFRANNINDSFLIISNVFESSFWGEPLNLFRFPIDMTISLVSISLVLILEIFEEKFNIYNKINLSGYATLKVFLIVIIIILIILLGIWEEVDFLYFQF